MEAVHPECVHMHTSRLTLCSIVAEFSELYIRDCFQKHNPLVAYCCNLVVNKVLVLIQCDLIEQGMKVVIVLTVVKSGCYKLCRVAWHLCNM